METIGRNTGELNAESVYAKQEEQNLRDTVTIQKVQDRAMSLKAYWYA